MSVDLSFNKPISLDSIINETELTHKVIGDSTFLVDKYDNEVYCKMYLKDCKYLVHGITYRGVSNPTKILDVLAINFQVKFLNDEYLEEIANLRNQFYDRTMNEFGFDADGYPKERDESEYQSFGGVSDDNEEDSPF